MQVDILTPDKSIFSGEASSVTVPGAMGSFEILNNHAPIISTLDDGKLVIRTSGGAEIFRIKGGVVEVNENKVIVLAESILQK